MKKTRASGLSGLIAGGTFLVFYLIIQMGIIPSLLLSLLAFVGGLLLFKPTNNQIAVYQKKLSKTQINKIVNDGKYRVKKIRREARGITKEKVKEDVMDICNLADDIFDDFKKDPKDIKVARKFTNYYLETTEKIILKYIELYSGTSYTDKEKQTLNKVESILEQIKETFSLQLNKLVEDDFLDLDTELKVLDMTMKSEGV